MKQLRLESRIKRVEGLAYQKKGRRLFVIVKAFGETEQEALSRHPHAQGENVDLIFTTSFVDPAAPVPAKPSPPTPVALDADEEICSLVAELEAEGVTRDEIAALLHGEAPSALEPASPEKVREPLSCEEELERFASGFYGQRDDRGAERLVIQPKKSEDLMGLFKRRGRVRH